MKLTNNDDVANDIGHAHMQQTSNHNKDHNDWQPKQLNALPTLLTYFLSETGKVGYVYFQIKIAQMTLKIGHGDGTIQ